MLSTVAWKRRSNSNGRRPSNFRFVIPAQAKAQSLLFGSHFKLEGLLVTLTVNANLVASLQFPTTQLRPAERKRIKRPDQSIQTVGSIFLVRSRADEDHGDLDGIGTGGIVDPDHSPL